MASNILEINKLNVGFKTFSAEKHVLNIHNISIPKGGNYGLVGESGAGKTVLALTILQLLQTPPAVIHSGEIIFDTIDLLKIPKKIIHEKYCGRRISMIFQDPMSTLNPVFTVGEQIGNILERHQNLRGKAKENKTLEVLDMVKMPDTSSLLKKYPHELSGGQRQRVTIAIALSCGAEFLIADEPTRNLDVTIQAGILKLIDEIQNQLNVSVLYIANNLGLVNVTCKEIGILYQGNICEAGKTTSVINNPRHPYTQTLLSAIPKNKNDKLKFADIIMRERSDRSCIYYARCPIAGEKCRTQSPEMKTIEPYHQAACFYL